MRRSTLRACARRRFIPFAEDDSLARTLLCPRPLTAIGLDVSARKRDGANMQTDIMLNDRMPLGTGAYATPSVDTLCAANAAHVLCHMARPCATRSFLGLRVSDVPALHSPPMPPPLSSESVPTYMCPACAA